MKKLLITGSEGIVGSVLVAGLSKHYDLYRLDRADLREKKYFRVDISDFESLKKVFEKIVGPDYVIHLAADSHADATWESVLRNNIIGVHNLYEAAKLYKIKKVIFASTNHVTGAYEGFPPILHEQKNPKKIKISDPVRPDGDYATSKVFGEIVARQYFELYGLPSISIRIGSFSTSNKPDSERFERMYLSHRDTVQLFNKALNSQVDYGIYYGISKNSSAFFDIKNAQADLGYEPQDDGSKV